MNEAAKNQTSMRQYFLSKRLAVALVAFAFMLTALWAVLACVLYDRQMIGYFTPLPDGFPEWSAGTPTDNETLALSLLSETMNTVKRVDNAVYPKDYESLEAHVARGKGLICGGMALLYSYKLTEHGFRNRIVRFRRELQSTYDTHASVEVYLHGRWVLLDPTFHIRLWRGNKPAMSLDLMQELYDGTEDSIHIQYLGRTRYPTRVSNYYIDFRRLPRHLEYLAPASLRSSWLVRHTPLRYFPTLRVYYVVPPGNEGVLTERVYAALDREFLLMTVVLPVVILLLGGTGLWLLVVPLVRSRRC
jgi:hypothetical protein